MSVLVVTGTGTGVGKTVVTAAIAVLTLDAGRKITGSRDPGPETGSGSLETAITGGVAVLKPAQTGVGPGEPGDLDDVARLAGEGLTGQGLTGRGLTLRELARYPEPLAPATAARRAGLPAVTPADVAAAARELAGTHDLVLVEGAGGLLVHLDDDGGTLADVAALLGAPVLVVAAAGLGTLNHTALTVEVLRTRGIECAGVVVGAWPAAPDLAARCNLTDLPRVTGVPLLGALPEGAGALDPATFRAIAADGLRAEFVERTARRAQPTRVC